MGAGLFAIRGTGLISTGFHSWGTGLRRLSRPASIICRSVATARDVRDVPSGRSSGYVLGRRFRAFRRGATLQKTEHMANDGFGATVGRPTVSADAAEMVDQPERRVWRGPRRWIGATGAGVIGDGMSQVHGTPHAKAIGGAREMVEGPTVSTPSDLPPPPS
jgi:hypothetical protein